jgi:hypothetical protein
VMHQVECVIDVIQPHGVRHHVVNIDLSVHVFVDVTRQFSSATHSGGRLQAEMAA